MDLINLELGVLRLVIVMLVVFATILVFDAFIYALYISKGEKEEDKKYYKNICIKGNVVVVLTAMLVIVLDMFGI